MDFESMQRVLIDMSTGTPPEKSKLKYDDALLAYRQRAEARFAAARQQNPNARIDIPTSIEGIGDPEN